MQVIAVTGLSGSGKSVAIRQLEDSGYYCIDNLPVDFIVPVIQSLRDRGFCRHPLQGRSPDGSAPVSGP